MIDLVRSFAVVLLFSCPLIAQSVTISDRKISGPFGPVHSIRTEAFNCSGDTTEQPWRTDEVTYDRQGNETWRAYSNRDGSVGHQVSNTFDADGRMTGWNEYYGKSNFPPAGLHRHAVFTYSNGKVFQILVYSENVLEYKGTYWYDDRGNKTREVTLELGSGGTTTRNYKYDNANRVVEEIYEMPMYSSKNQFEYDAAGNKIKETVYEKGSVAFSIVRAFENGRLAKQSTFGSDGSIRRIESKTYNGAGDLASITIDDESVKSKTTIEYYDNGKIRSKDSVTVAKENGKPMGSEDQPIPGRILEKYNEKGEQVERYMYDPAGKQDLKQISRYNELGQQIGLTEISSGGQYDRNLMYEYDSYRNRVKTSCVETGPNGELRYSLAEQSIITYY